MLKFSTRGQRRTAGFGLYYRSECGKYEIYKSDQCAGLPVRPVRWVAIFVLGNTIINRHTKRAAAVKTCERHAKTLDAARKVRGKRC